MASMAANENGISKRNIQHRKSMRNNGGIGAAVRRHHHRVAAFTLVAA
jgi:hypothetical protein